MARSLVEATKKFVEASDWLGDEDLPAIVMLETIAEVVDRDGPQPALLSQYGLTHRSLLKRAPGAPSEVDPLAAALEAVQ